LAAFSGNRIHDNAGDQVFVGGGNWDLSGSGCDGGQNAFYDYTPGFVGLAVDGGKVIANDDSWQDSSPSAGVDYSATGVVTPTSFCGDAG
jgi:hypothetical protein